MTSEDEMLVKRLEECIAQLRSGEWSMSTWCDRAEGLPVVITMESLGNMFAPKVVKREFEFCLIRNTKENKC